ncbi:MAG: hypothetical protein K9N23_10700 [Akkermansiaceae bacterium]|nr:hypothetical protein [Akkermansiaceae bacterium]
MTLSYSETQIHIPVLATTPAITPGTTSAVLDREMDITVNPYAAALHEPGKSKRAWNAGYIESFQQSKNGDPVRFELTNGVMAEGRVNIVTMEGGAVSFVSGKLTAPEKGKFFIMKAPEGGKAGKAIAVVEFPASKTACRVEPTGANGDPELWQRRLDEVVCMGMEEADPKVLEEDLALAGEEENIVPLRPDDRAQVVPTNNSDIVSLQSYPGSPAVLLLDFFGGSTHLWGAPTYTRPPVDNYVIRDVWKRVSEDYIPFNINVTTDMNVYRAAAPGNRGRCCFTTTPVTAAGAAYFGSWNWGGEIMCWSVYIGGKSGAEVAAHEVGHMLGLAHQGQSPGEGEYFSGHGGGELGWCPIMGVGYYRLLTTWAKGEYENANQPQDELQTITTANNSVHYRDDDTGNTLATSRYLEVKADNTVSAEGVIERSGDTDSFQFTTTGGAITLTASPVAPADYSNLATKASIANSADTVIASVDAQDSISSTISTTLAAGTYTFRVTGSGKNDPQSNGFTDYGSLGYYSVSGSVAGARQPTRPSCAPTMKTNLLANKGLSRCHVSRIIDLNKAHPVLASGLVRFEIGFPPWS